MPVTKDFFSHRLILARKELGLSQSELARQVSVHRSTVVRWERGLYPPDDVQMLQLVEVLGKPLSWFSEQRSAEVQDTWVDQVPWRQIQELTSGALRSLGLSSKLIAAKSAIELNRVRAVIKGKLPTRKEVEVFRECFGEAFDPTPRHAPGSSRWQAFSDSEKLDLILYKLVRLEAEVLDCRDVLFIQRSRQPALHSTVG